MALTSTTAAGIAFGVAFVWGESVAAAGSIVTAAPGAGAAGSAVGTSWTGGGGL